MIRCRPQILLLSKPDENLIPRHPKMFSFASQLKAGKGLIIAASVVEGDYLDKAGEAIAAKQVRIGFKVWLVSVLDLGPGVPGIG